jgi:20S proteasome alpha/beta subunit
MNFQTEHIETYSYQKSKSMTTVLAIICNEGIVLAGDSQGVLGDMTIEVRKLFKINNSIGLVGAGFEDQTIDLVNHLKTYLKDMEFSSELTLKDRIEEAISNLHSLKNVIGSLRSGYQNTCLIFHPNALIGAKLKNGKFCLYEIGFGSDEKNGVLSGGVLTVNQYRALGSGSKYATYIIKQQNKIHNLENWILMRV